MALTADQLRAYGEFFEILANIKRRCLLEEAELHRKEPALQGESLSLKRHEYTT